MAATKQKHRRTSKGTLVPQRGLAARVASVEKATLRSDLPDFRSGDTIRVHFRIKEGDKERLQAFEGIVIGRSNRGGSQSVTLRKVSHGVGVERVFLISSPKVAKIDVVQEGKVRRSKLYYLRGLQGKAAKIEREVETQASAAQSAAAKESATKA